MIIKKDVVIVGYGPVAMATAVILAKNGLNITVINPFDRYERDVHLATRLIALSLSSVNLFKKHNIFSNLEIIGQAINKIHVIQHGKDGFLEFDPSYINKQNFGYMIDEEEIWNSLYQEAINHNVHFIDSKIYDIIHTQNRIEIALANNIMAHAELLLAADGKHSFIRKKLHFETEKKKYNQIAIVCDIKHENHHSGIACEYFMQNGPFATLPKLDGFSSSIVWTESSNTEHFFQTIETELFTEFIQSRCSNSLGKINIISKVTIFPLQLIRSKIGIAERVALLGDAWHAIHPLAGQGLNLGLRDVNQITQQIIEEKRLGLDLGSNAMLRDYNKARCDDITLLISAMNVINNIYKSRLPFINDIGEFMIKFMNGNQLFKKLFMHYAAYGPLSS